MNCSYCSFPKFRALNHWLVLDRLKWSNAEDISRLETESVTNRNLKSEAMLDSESWAGASASINFKTCAWAFVAWQEIHFLHLIGCSKKFHSGFYTMWGFPCDSTTVTNAGRLIAFPVWLEAQDTLVDLRCFWQIAACTNVDVDMSWTPGLTREHLHPPCTSQ